MRSILLVVHELALYDAPDLYDLAMSPNPSAEAFYIDEARRRGGRVLTLACGSGRFAIPLARAGIQVVGLDVAPAMLERAKTKAQEALVEIEWVLGDMRNYDLEEKQFGLITIAANSLLHLHAAQDIVDCMRTAARHLAPHGALAFDIWCPSLALLARAQGKRYKVGNFVDTAMGALLLEETSDYDSVSQVQRTTCYWSAQDRPDFLVVPLHLRQIFPQELPLLLERAGLRLRERYGSFDRTALPGQDRQVCVCELA
jgi:SAM-dependent methyltransferase